MKHSLSFVAIAIALAGCLGVAGTDASGNPAVTEADIEAIEGGSATGAWFSGSFKTTEKVIKTNCTGLNILPGLPVLGEVSEDTITFVQTNGELTRGIDDLGSAYTFRGAVDSDGGFEYGQFYQIPGVDFSVIEMVEGEVDRGDNGMATGFTAMANRRYQAAIIDCSADIEITAELGDVNDLL